MFGHRVTTQRAAALATLLTNMSTQNAQFLSPGERAEYVALLIEKLQQAHGVKSYRALELNGPGRSPDATNS